MVFGLFGPKKCYVCGKEIKGKGVSADGKRFCCEKDRKYCEEQMKKGKPAKKAQVCEFC